MSVFSDLKKSFVRIFCDDQVVGCGFLVSRTHLLTCAHVVDDAVSPDRPNGSVTVDFPFLPEQHRLDAKVVAKYPMNSEQLLEDIAVLHSVEIPYDAVPIDLSIENANVNNDVRIPGCPRNWNDDIRWVNRKLNGDTSRNRVQIDRNNQDGVIEPGFSGAPVWDETLQAVVGMVAEVYDGEMPEISAFMIPTSVLCQAWSELAYVELKGILDSHKELPIETIAYAYARSCNRDWPGSRPKTLAHYIQELNKMPDQDGYSALVKFAAYLFNDLKQSASHEEALLEALRNWGCRQIQRFDEILIEISQGIKAREAENSYLMVIVKRDLNKKNHYVAEAHFISDAREYKRNSSKGFEPLSVDEDNLSKSFTYNQLPRVISQFTDAVPSEHDFAIELFLPKELLSKPIEMAKPKKDHPPIGCSYCLIIRSEERITKAGMKEYGRFWARKWKQMPKPGEKLAIDSLISGDGESSDAIYQHLQQTNTVGLKLIQEPLSTGKRSALTAMYTSGAPIAIWLRQPLRNLRDTEIDELLNCCLYGLPQIAQNQRMSALDNSPDSHIGHHLALLWDDFDRFPPGYRIVDRIDPESGEEKLQIAHNPLKMS